MSIHLTADQIAALSGESLPIRVVGSDSTFVLISEEAYERLRQLVDLTEPTSDEQTAQIQQFGALAGWDDPEWNSYEDLRPKS